MSYPLLALAMALTCGLAQAQTASVPPPWLSLPFACLPAVAGPGATGSQLIPGANAVGWFVAWWCPGVDKPQVFAVRWDSTIKVMDAPEGQAFMRDPYTATANTLRLKGEDIDGPRLAPIWRPSLAKIVAARPVK